MKNKIKTFAAIIVISITLSSIGCKKESNKPNTPPAVTTGSLYVLNNELDPYNIYIDGKYMGILSPNKVSTNATIVTSGIGHGMKAVQYSGYIISPSVYTGSVTVNAGGTITWSF